MNINSIAEPFSLNFLVYFSEISSYFSMNKTKETLENALSAWRNFPRRFDLANGKYLRRAWEGELREIKRKRDKTKISKEIHDKSKQIIFEVIRAWDYFTTWKVICIMYLYWNMFQQKTLHYVEWQYRTVKNINGGY